MVEEVITGVRWIESRIRASADSTEARVSGCGVEDMMRG
jgi:hypothetical protein